MKSKFWGVLSLTLLFAAQGAGTAGAQDQAAAADRALSAMRAAASVDLTITRSPRTRLATFVAAPAGRSIPAPNASAQTAQDRALSFVSVYGNAFGLRGTQDVALVRSERDELGIDHVRLRQVRAGIPVTGGELIVHLRGNQVLAANGKTLDAFEGVSLDPTVTSLDALGAARQFVTRAFNAPLARLSEPRLEIFNQGILTGRAFPTRLAWFVEARGEALRQFIWIDARNRMVLMNFSQLTDAKNRTIYDGTNTRAALPGTLIRTEGQAPSGPSNTTDALNAYNFVGHAYDYFFTQHGRDSFDNLGTEIKSTVRYCDLNMELPCPYDNAFWDGAQLAYGAGFTVADDVVAHEFTHGVIEKTANLFYYMQSGALNESYADIFGETIDQTNGTSEPGGSRWMVGEELPGGAERHMLTPNLPPYSDPGKMSDSQFRCDTDPIAEDAGGVHTNSGVPNHAFALMVDGGGYNSFTISPLDGNQATSILKAAKIQYRALTQYLTSASDFLDNYNAIQQACTDLIGTSGITAGNCVEVKKALDAVEMSSVWPCSPTQAAPPALCSAGFAPQNVFYDSFETGLGNWTISGDGGTWFRTSNPNNPLNLGNPTVVAYATHGVDSLWGYNQGSGAPVQSFISRNANLTIPAGARLHFNHSYGFEDSGGVFYDGGLAEYSTDGGTNWTPLTALNIGGATYGGSIFASAGNPLAGQPAFVGDSYGFTASQYNLASLAGQTQVRFRFGIGADDIIDDYGWFIDEFRVYTCVPPPTVVTLAATGVTFVGATLNGTVNPNGGSTTAHFDFGPTSSYGTQIPVAIQPGSGTGAVAITGTVSGLGCGQTYHTRAVATNPAGTTEGNDVVVQTAACVAPTGVTQAATSITGGGATLNATVNPNSLSTSALFEYGLNTSYGNQIAVAVPPGSGVVPVSVAAAVTGLNCGQTYHARVVATNAVGPTNGNDVTFQTSPCALSIANVSIIEADSGTTDAVFAVTLDAPSLAIVTVSAVTSDITALAGPDYSATGPLTLTFNPGVVLQSFTVPVVGDLVLEVTETFQATLSSPTNAILADAIGIGTITDNDLPTRTFVSAGGSDAADCSIQTTPCRNIAGALPKTAIDGEIIILTPGEYETAPLTLAKGIKITSPSGTVAFIRQPITIDASSGRVVLRGLTLKGAAADEAITLVAAGSVSIEDVTIDRWETGLFLANTVATQVTILNSAFRANVAGIGEGPGGPMNVVAIEDSRFEGNTNGIQTQASSLHVRESLFTGNTTTGLLVGPGRAEVKQSVFSMNGTGIASLTGGTVRISRSHVFGNNVGFAAGAGSTFESFGTNVVRGNGTDTTGTIATIPEQ